MLSDIADLRSQDFAWRAAAPARGICSIDEWLAHLPFHSSNVLIFQNVYEDNVIGKLDPSFLPLDGRRNAGTELREVGLFLRLFHSGLFERGALVGVVSPKFNEKTRISGREFISFIEKNPGFNVYFINPFPQNSYYSFNVWSHGELCHPGLTALAQILFERAGYDPRSLFYRRDSHATLLYSSYWVGDRLFWNGYVAMLGRLVAALDEMPPKLRDRYYRQDPEYPDPVPMLPFIFERTFSAYLHFNPAIRGLAFPFSREEILDYCGSGGEREIVGAFADLIDEIDKRKEYTQADREIFSALTQLRIPAARLRQAEP